MAGKDYFCKSGHFPLKAACNLSFRSFDCNFIKTIVKNILLETYSMILVLTFILRN